MRSLVFAAALLAAVPAVAAPAFQVYPVRGLFFTREAGAALIDEDFSKSEAADLGAYFEKKFRAAFPEAAKTIDDTNKRRTFAVSLQVARASVFLVPKPPTQVVDVYLPMTASLYFTNVMTGEILFAATRTDVPLGSILDTDVKAEGHPRIRGLFGRYFHELTDELIDDARKQFNPKTTFAQVRSEWNGLGILDQGERAGVATDDSFVDDQGNELRVVSVGPTYAIARAELGKIVGGGKYSRVSNATMAEIHKPRVLAFIDESPAQLPREALLQLFSDALGAKSPVSLLPVNSTFAEVLKSVATHAEISQDQVRQRELPDLFLRLHVYEPISFNAPTDKAYKSRRITQAIAFAEVQDRSGRVLFAASGRDRVQDEVVNNIAIDAGSRREIVVKNALIDLAKKFATGFQVKRLEVPVVEGSKTEVTLKDDVGALNVGAAVRIFHDIGRIDGIADSVRVPIWEVEIDEAGATPHGKLSLPITETSPAPVKGDVIVFEGVSTGRPARVRLGPCGAPEKLGAVDFPGYEPLMQNLFAANSPAPFYASGLATHVSSLLNASCGFKSELPFKEPKTELCVQTVHRIDSGEQACSDEGCADKLSVRLTYRIKKGAAGEVVTKHGLEAQVKGTTLPTATLAPDRAASIRADLTDEALELGPQITAAFAADKL